MCFLSFAQSAFSTARERLAHTGTLITKCVPATLSLTLLLVSFGATASRGTPQWTDYSAPSKSQASGSSGDFGPTRTVQIIDRVLGMVAATMEIPASWGFEGVVLRGPGCISDYASYAYRAYSPDLRYGFQLLPRSSFFWADDPRALPRNPRCKHLQPISAATFGQLVAAAIRPGSQVDSIMPAPDEGRFQANLPRGQRGELQRLHIHYDLNGQPEEELLEAKLISWVGSVNVNVSQDAMVRYRPMPQYVTSFEITTLRTPQGELKSAGPAILAMLQSMQVNPQHVTASREFSQRLANTNIALSWRLFNTTMKASDEEFAAMTQSAQQFIQGMDAQGEARHARVMGDIDRSGRHTQDVCDWILNQQLYRNPNTGQNVTTTNQVANAYQNERGVLAYSNGPFDPAEVYGGDWTRLLPIHH